MSFPTITQSLSPSVLRAIHEPGPFGLYVAELPGQGPVPLAKVGLVLSPEGLMERMDSLKSAGLLFFPVPVRAYAVERVSSKAWTPRRTERRVQDDLKVDLIPHVGEIFACPNASVQELVGAVEVALNEHRRTFVPINVGNLTEHYRKRNQDIWSDFTSSRKAEVACPYAEFRNSSASEPFHGLSGIGWNPQRMRELAFMGFLMADLLVGRGIESFTRSYDGLGSVTIYPPSHLQAALAEAEAEQQLVLRSRNRTRPGARLQSLLDPRARSLRIINDECFGRDIAGPFVLDLGAESNHYRFDAEHLACLGDHAVTPEFGSKFFGSLSRAPLPAAVFSVAREQPRLLPALRFLVGVVHAEMHEIPLQDYALPLGLRPTDDVMTEAAQVLQTVDCGLPPTLLDWVMHVWFSHRG